MEVLGSWAGRLQFYLYKTLRLRVRAEMTQAGLLLMERSAARLTSLKDGVGAEELGPTGNRTGSGRRHKHAHKRMRAQARAHKSKRMLAHPPARPPAHPPTHTPTRTQRIWEQGNNGKDAWSACCACGRRADDRCSAVTGSCDCAWANEYACATNDGSACNRACCCIFRHPKPEPAGKTF